MLAAAFETSTRTPSVALRVGDRSLQCRLSGERPHASDLLPALDGLLREAGARAADLELLVVGTGPGSFTGLRVAAATALGLARGGRARLLGLSSGESLCWRELAVGEEAAVVLDARSGEWYYSRYRRTADDVVELHAPCVATQAQWVQWVANAEHESRTGSAARIAPLRLFGEPLLSTQGALDAELRGRIEVDRVPEASAALELGLARLERGAARTTRELEPLYLRAFAAKKSQRMGS
jgi:tRNA threonylcarbamoyl adenosine modification protein YeaZ